MTTAALFRMFLLYGHLIACCFAICYVLSADLKILKGDLARDEMEKTARRMSQLLMLLWATGLPMVLIDLGGDLSALLSKPKLIAKLTCVVVLTLNAFVLHNFAFPQLMSGKSLSERNWKLVMCAGAVSTTSWLFAAFLGIAKPLASVLSVSGFLGLYALALSGAVLVSLLLAGAMRRQLYAGGQAALA